MLNVVFKYYFTFYHVNMFSMKLYPVDTINFWSVLPRETLVVSYMGQKSAASGGGHRPNSMNNWSHGQRMKG